MNPEAPLHAHIKTAVERYYETLLGEPVCATYELFLEQLEKPLLEATLAYTKNNQSQAAKVLGLNRGTLRTKLKKYDLL